jgi:hypothetical protein
MSRIETLQASTPAAGKWRVLCAEQLIVVGGKVHLSRGSIYGDFLRDESVSRRYIGQAC